MQAGPIPGEELMNNSTSPQQLPQPIEQQQQQQPMEASPSDLNDGASLQGPGTTTLSPCSFQQRCFSHESPEATLYFQILDLGRQLYVWVSVNGSQLGNLQLAIKTAMDPVPSVASILPAPPNSSCQSIAARLAARVGRPVLCSWNVPSSGPLLEVAAEKRLYEELRSMQLLK